MFVTRHQLFYALVLFCGGFITSIPTDFLTCFRLAKPKILAIIGNLIYFSCCFLWYVVIKNLFGMPSVLAYMPLLFMAGMYVEGKILSKTVAFFRVYVYNITNKLVIKLRTRVAQYVARRSYAGKQNEKRNSCIGGNGYTTVVYTVKRNGFSDDKHKKRTSQNRRVRSANRSLGARNRPDRRPNRALDGGFQD